MAKSQSQFETHLEVLGHFARVSSSEYSLWEYVSNRKSERTWMSTDCGNICLIENFGPRQACKLVEEDLLFLAGSVLTSLSDIRSPDIVTDN